MKSLPRLIRIFKIARRYRLDTLASGLDLPWLVKPLIKPLPNSEIARMGRGERLRRALEELGPVYVKFGQMLSTRPDLVPPDICSELAKLQDQVAPFDGATFTRIVEKALHKPIAELFQTFDPEPLASASVAQVHAATLKSGREVVVKVIRPGVGKTIERDIALLQQIAKLVEKYHRDGPRLRPQEVVEEYSHTLANELDLQYEAANTSLLRHNFTDSPLLYVPEVEWEYTNHKVMVVERIYATPVTDIETLRASGCNFKTLAERGVEIFFTQLLEHNFFHADMHPGNIFVDTSDPEKPKYLAIDCAIMGSLSDEDRYYMARNLLAIFRRDYRQVAELHLMSGWVPEGTPVAEFAGAIRSVCEPIFRKPLKEISLGAILINLFSTARKFDMEVQPSLVLLQKTLLNIEGLGRQLYPDLDLWQTAHPYLENWLKERYKPAGLMETLKYHGPDWLERFPEVPQLVFEGLSRLRDHKPSPVAPVRSRSGQMAGAILIGSSAGYMYAQSGQLLAVPGLVWLAMAAGLILLIKR